jgi:hypothetical protein|tara:strand:+ start:507 stop:7226 length:6720 start_codon:yes stop_codon:yes gene_type:complete
MARKVIDTGAVGNDGTGDSIRDSFQKVNDNFRELYSSLGLGERLTFIGLNDSPATYLGNEGAILAVNPTTDAIVFKNIVGGVGVAIDDTTNSSEISISTEFSEISGDTSPQLGGNLSARSGGNQYRIQDLPTPVSDDEGANKGYVDTKISVQGVDAVDPETGQTNSAFGTMGGPLILSRDPEPDDDTTYDGLIAATKGYVDKSSFGSSVNLYVATSGADERPGVSEELQGRALAYAYRSIEAALKRAEEIVLDSQKEIGPYKKILTFNNGANDVTLNSIETSPDSGTGFAGTVTLSVDTISIATVGANYLPGDIITLDGGAGSVAKYEVLSTASTPGAVVTFRQISSGNYSSLPGSTNVPTTSDSQFGAGATFNITYRVAGVTISNPGSGYSLVSVRINGGGETKGGFGIAQVVSGEITGIEITDQGSGFTTIPNVVADLPRFLLTTEGQRTDFTGDVLTDTPIAFRTRDIREGLFLRGEDSGALAQILGHTGELDSLGNEIFDVDIKFGDFTPGEVISYGDVSNQVNLTIKVESGIYEEHYPLKVPQNVSIVGDEFRRCIIRPKPGTSSSPWAFSKFRRDTVIDGLQVTDRLYGHHYLHDTSQPVYPKIDNAGNYKNSATLLKLNKVFIQNEVVEWIDNQIANSIAPFDVTFQYNKNLCKRDVGLLVDSMIFDLKYGGYNRTISAALKYFESASARLAITTQLSETIAGIRRIDYLASFILNNVELGTSFQTTFPQIIDTAFVKETGTETVFTDLVDAVVDVISSSGSVNYPEENQYLDVFLANDAVRWQGITMQGHGGFALTLDPEGQILAKSPYAQECAAFSRSINKQIFAGGMFVDGFAGNLQFEHLTSTSDTRLGIGGLERFPQLPASFIVDDAVFRINYVRDFVYSPSGSTATFVLDETTPFTRPAGFQTLTGITVANPGVFTKNDHRLQSGAIVRFRSVGGGLPAPLVADRDYYVFEDSLTNNTFQIKADFDGSVPIEITTTGSGTIQYQRIYEVLMPGNRSMLSNDFTQVADMGYGLIATNGGLTESVSMFTYYCYASYYSINGAQIRSVGGSSAHGIYALVAEGSDPLEVPTPVSLYNDLAQRVDCYAPTPAFATTTNGLFVHVTNYDYTPLNNSELEVDHGNLIFRYPVTSVTTQDLPAGVARLNLTSDETGNFDGLFAQIPDGTKLSLRSNSQVILTGDIVNVATRPSTGLKLAESKNVYRVLQFEDHSDTRGNFEVEFTPGAIATIRMYAIIDSTDSGTDIATFTFPHRLRTGDTFVPTSTQIGMTSGVTYYVKDVPKYDQAIFSTSPGGVTLGLTTGSSLGLKGLIPHKQLRNYIFTFLSTGTLPTGIIEGQKYYVRETGLTTTSFQVSESLTTNAIGVTDAGTGTITANVEGLGKTTLRENYDYIDLTLYKPGELVGTTGAGLTFSEGTKTPVTISIAAPAVFTAVGHGLVQGDCIVFQTTDKLPTGLSESIHYFVYSVPTPDTFTVSAEWYALAAATQAESSVPQAGTHTFAKVKGKAGDTEIAVVPVAPADRSRVPGSRVLFLGEEYVISSYESEDDINVRPYARITLDRPLEQSVLDYGATYTIRSAVPVRSVGADGNLTIRISLTRVTSHDLLDIGTGSYADTNYPNEIYGPPVNSVNAATETDERDVGRVFYVTTDQFGNFRVGPFFSVDQGTGQVTFSAAIALSNLDGLGFKRGVPIAEFSTDSGFSDNAVDTVPTENAARVYIERRLGKTHNGAAVPQGNLLPPLSGGFLALDGGLPMKGPVDMNVVNKIVNLADPTDGTDAVNLRSLTFENIQNFGFTDTKANEFIVFTGVGQQAINATVVGDIDFNIDSTANTIDAQINPDTILNADINSTAGVEQSKLLMNLAGTAAAAPTGTQADKQAASGVVSFDDAQFVASNGWITLKDNGTPRSALAQVTARSVIGNNQLTLDDAADVPFTTVVDNGGALKKAQYGTTGFVRRTNALSNASDLDYTVIEAVAAYTGSGDNNTLIQRDSNGDFAANNADFSTLKIDTKTAIDTGTISSGGFIRLYTYGGNGGIYLQDGSLSSDKTNQYWNNKHEFKTQDGLSNAPITASSVETLVLTTGGNTTTGTVTGRWSLTGSSPNESRFEATYAADLAEYYEGDKEYEVGTVLVFGGDKEVTTTKDKMSRKVAGVVSDRAAYVMYSACPGFKNLVALQGRVPVKVVGKIEKGDTLVTSHIEGVAIVSDDPKAGTIIGKAIEAYDSDHIGTIEVAVGRS